MAINEHLDKLRMRHKQLEQELKTLKHHPSVSTLDIANLKRKKLHLKDEIEKLQLQALAS